MSCTFEMKDTRGKDSLPFSEVKQAQIDWGLAVNSDNGVLIRTQAIVEGMPDYCYYRNAPAYFICKYPKAFYIIPVRNWIFEKEKSKRKSLTIERAEAIAVKTIKVK